MTLREKLQKAMDYPWCVFYTRRTRWVERKTFVAPMPGETVEWHPSKNSANDLVEKVTRDKTPTS